MLRYFTHKCDKATVHLHGQNKIMNTLFEEYMHMHLLYG